MATKTTEWGTAPAPHTAAPEDPLRARLRAAEQKIAFLTRALHTARGDKAALQAQVSQLQAQLAATAVTHAEPTAHATSLFAADGSPLALVTSPGSKGRPSFASAPSPPASGPSVQQKLFSPSPTHPKGPPPAAPSASPPRSAATKAVSMKPAQGPKKIPAPQGRVSPPPQRLMKMKQRYPAKGPVKQLPRDPVHVALQPRVGVWHGKPRKQQPPTTGPPVPEQEDAAPAHQERFFGGLGDVIGDAMDFAQDALETFDDDGYAYDENYEDHYDDNYDDYVDEPFDEEGGEEEGEELPEEQPGYGGSYHTHHNGYHQVQTHHQVNHQAHHQAPYHQQTQHVQHVQPPPHTQHADPQAGWGAAPVTAPPPLVEEEPAPEPPGPMADRGTIRMFSGCKDSQTSADVFDVASFGLPPVDDESSAGGACTNALLSTLQERPSISYGDLILEMQAVLKRRKYTQVPQLSASSPVDLHGEQFTIVHPATTGRTKALLIGINYVGQKGELKGCVNDVKMMRDFVISQGYSEERECLRVVADGDEDDQAVIDCAPTAANIFAGMRWLLDDAQPGDSLFLHYSGHGGQMKDQDGDEEDGMDEALIPADYKTAGMIRDDTVFKLLAAPLPHGVHMVCVFDCCHSGTILDLPFSFALDDRRAAELRSGGRPAMASNTRFGAGFGQLLGAFHRDLEAEADGVLEALPDARPEVPPPGSAPSISASQPASSAADLERSGSGSMRGIKGTAHVAGAAAASRALRWIILKHRLPLSLEEAAGPLLSDEPGMVSVVPIDGQPLVGVDAVFPFAAQLTQSRDLWPEDAAAQAAVVEALAEYGSTARAVTDYVVRPLLGRAAGTATDADATVAIVGGCAAFTAAMQRLDTALGGRPFIAGAAVTVADYLIAAEVSQLPALRAWLPSKMRLEHFPAVQQHLRRMAEVQGFEETLGPFKAFLRQLRTKA